MSLYDATKDLHHACEAHALGGRMSKGNVTPQEWADWLAAAWATGEDLWGQIASIRTKSGLIEAMDPISVDYILDMYWT